VILIEICKHPSHTVAKIPAARQSYLADGHGVIQIDDRYLPLGRRSDKKGIRNIHHVASLREINGTDWIGSFHIPVLNVTFVTSLVKSPRD
jgi:hypothetical protein